ncbi:MAG TPA: endonuclease III [Desulfobacteraceae bacterium]|nr:endonuclease III [Deltaproteobacteria bacterium]MBW2355166.1 endonuclease III [Deltaproteobacteria bacterium]RLB98598.1 MAG: endonuclease III [Deltaproteobacteria bacterium]HDI59380.1 endonuclease III [Desulfobacteraceae bacterium]
MPSAPFDIHRFMAVLGSHYPEWQAPVVTLIAERGATPFEILVSTLLSLRTKDQVTIVASRRLLAAARTPEAILALDVDAIGRLIYPVGFWKTKAERLRQVSAVLIERHGGQVPASLEALLALPGVGRKTANLVRIEGFGLDGICVDTHVHRISNRVGYVRTKTPEQTEMRLRGKLPRRYWVRYNEILVAFGQVICQPVSPWCSRCPVADLCRQVGVKHRR